MDSVYAIKMQYLSSYRMEYVVYRASAVQTDKEEPRAVAADVTALSQTRVHAHKQPTRRSTRDELSLRYKFGRQ